jgi:predicted metal-dependent phosphoesterase TrpH
VEVYNSKHLFGIANARARMGAKKRHLPMVAGSDSHFAATVGLGVTEIEAVNAEGTAAAIRADARAGQKDAAEIDAFLRASRSKSCREKLPMAWGRAGTSSPVKAASTSSCIIRGPIFPAH